MKMHHKSLVEGELEVVLWDSFTWQWCAPHSHNILMLVEPLIVWEGNVLIILVPVYSVVLNVQNVNFYSLFFLL